MVFSLASFFLKLFSKVRNELNLTELKWTEEKWLSHNWIDIETVDRSRLYYWQCGEETHVKFSLFCISFHTSHTYPENLRCSFLSFISLTFRWGTCEGIMACCYYSLNGTLFTDRQFEIRLFWNVNPCWLVNSYRSFEKS